MWENISFLKWTRCTVAPKRGGEPPAWQEEWAGWKDSHSPEMVEAVGGPYAYWDHLSAAQLPRKSGDVMVEPWVREVLVRLNPRAPSSPTGLTR